MEGQKPPTRLLQRQEGRPGIRRQLDAEPDTLGYLTVRVPTDPSDMMTASHRAEGA